MDYSEGDRTPRTLSRSLNIVMVISALNTQAGGTDADIDAHWDGVEYLDSAALPTFRTGDGFG
jgi:hypothetical protein